MTTVMKCRGIKGATTADRDEETSILEVARELFEKMIVLNGVTPEDVAAVHFTCTPDLTAAFPARVARDLGFQDVPLLGSQEMNVPHAPKLCIRVLMLVNTDRSLSELVHVYLRGAARLRPEYARESKF